MWIDPAAIVLDMSFIVKHLSSAFALLYCNCITSECSLCGFGHVPLMYCAVYI
jgi:hypothetical protein